MWKAEYVMTTDVTPAALYRAITDINNWSEWDTGLEYTRRSLRPAGFLLAEGSW